MVHVLVRTGDRRMNINIPDIGTAGFARLLGAERCISTSVHVHDDIERCISVAEEKPS